MGVKPQPAWPQWATLAVNPVPEALRLILENPRATASPGHVYRNEFLHVKPLEHLRATQGAANTCLHIGLLLKVHFSNSSLMFVCTTISISNITHLLASSHVLNSNYSEKWGSMLRDQLGLLQRFINQLTDWRTNYVLKSQSIYKQQLLRKNKKSHTFYKTRRISDCIQKSSFLEPTESTSYPHSLFPYDSHTGLICQSENFTMNSVGVGRLRVLRSDHSLPSLRYALCIYIRLCEVLNAKDRDSKILTFVTRVLCWGSCWFAELFARCVLIRG